MHSNTLKPVSPCDWLAWCGLVVLVWFGSVWFVLVWFDWLSWCGLVVLVWFGFGFGLFWCGLVLFGWLWVGLIWFDLVWFGWSIVLSIR